MQTVASLLGLSQPAISSTLKVLESGCGQTLFERTPRGLLPTRASLDILFPVRRALNELRHIDTDISALQGRLQGVVQVGALPLGRTRILPEAIVRNEKLGLPTDYWNLPLPQETKDYVPRMPLSNR